MVHLAALERLIVEPNGVCLFVVDEHAVLEIEYFANEQHEKLLLDAACVISVLTYEHHLEWLLEIVAFLFGQLVQRVLHDVIASHEQTQERIHRIDRGHKYGRQVLSIRVSKRNLVFFVVVCC